jgi:hypothetical protein
MRAEERINFTKKVDKQTGVGEEMINSLNFKLQRGVREKERNIGHSEQLE